MTICSLLISLFGCSCASHSRERAGAKPQGRLVELRFTSSGMAAEPYEQFCFAEADDDILPELDSLIRRHRLWRCYSHYYSRYILDGDSHALNAIYEHPDGTRQTIHLSCSGSMPKPLRALVEHLRINYAPVDYSMVNNIMLSYCTGSVPDEHYYWYEYMLTPDSLTCERGNRSLDTTREERVLQPGEFEAVRDALRDAHLRLARDTDPMSVGGGRYTISLRHDDEVLLSGFIRSGSGGNLRMSVAPDCIIRMVQGRE